MVLNDLRTNAKKEHIANLVLVRQQNHLQNAMFGFIAHFHQAEL